MQLAVCASELRDKLADHCDIVAGLEASSGYQRTAPDGLQDLLQLAQAIGGIDVDENQTGFRRRKLRDRPFRANFPSKTSVGGSMSLLKASAVFAKPRWASAPL